MPDLLQHELSDIGRLLRDATQDCLELEKCHVFGIMRDDPDEDPDEDEQERRIDEEVILSAEIREMGEQPLRRLIERLDEILHTAHAREIDRRGKRV